jgi:hypothetical protein
MTDHNDHNDRPWAVKELERRKHDSLYGLAFGVVIGFILASLL